MTQAAHSSEENIGADIAGALRKITKALDRDSRSLPHEFGINRTQLLVLREMQDGGSLAPGEIARRIQLAQATVSESIKHLSRAGLVERARSDHDRRQVLCSLTASGIELVGRCPLVIEERFLGRLVALPEWEQRSVVATLKRVAELFDGGVSEEKIRARAPEALRGRARIGPANASR